MSGMASCKTSEQKNLLYDAKVCRLCGDKNENGRTLFRGGESNEECEVVKLINQYLPVTVEDDGIFPRWICPGCHIQLESTSQFFKMILKGQQLISSMLAQEKQARDAQQNASKITRVDDLGPLYDTLDQAKWNELFGKPNLEATDRDDVLVPLELSELEDLLEQEDNLPETARQQQPPEVEHQNVEEKNEELEKDHHLQVSEGSSNEGWKNAEEDWIVESEVTKLNGRLIGFIHDRNNTVIGSLVVNETGKKRTHAKFVCDICSKMFVQEFRYLKHRKTHSILFECSVCLLKFGSSVKLRVHQIETQHNGRGIIEGLQLDGVSLTRGGGDAYACDICEDTFPELTTVLEHEESVHAGENRSFVCSDCGKSFREKNLLRRHRDTHTEERPHQCTVCAAAFKTRSTLAKHVRSHTDTKRYHCTMCTQRFANKTGLDLHQNWHNGVKPFECEFCSKRFSQRGNLKEHLRVHSGDKPFSCGVCAATFGTSSQHRLHIKRHANERSHKCELCNKTFIMLQNYKIHMRRHRNEKPYACKECGRAFPERCALRKHIRTHTHAKPYICQHCAKPFSDSSNLLRHVKIIHGKQPKTEGTSAPSTLAESSAVIDGAVSGSDSPAAVSIEEPEALVTLTDDEMIALDATFYKGTLYPLAVVNDSPQRSVLPPKPHKG